MADSTFTLDSEFIGRQKRRIMQSIQFAEYQVNGTWHDADIQSKQILADGRIEVVFVIDHSVTGNITVTGVRLRDMNGDLIGSRNVDITRADVTEGISYAVRFQVFQVVRNSQGTGAYDAL